jgi:hypothetical protein
MGQIFADIQLTTPHGPELRSIPVHSYKPAKSLYTALQALAINYKGHILNQTSIRDQVRYSGQFCQSPQNKHQTPCSLNYFVNFVPFVANKETQ